MNKIVTAMNFIDDELIAFALENLETESKAEISKSTKTGIFKMHPKRWIAALVSLLTVVILTPVIYFSLPKNSGTPAGPGFYMSVELPKTQFGIDDTVFVNISVGLYNKLPTPESLSDYTEGLNWIVMIHDYKSYDDYSNATILAVLDFPPEPLDKYLYREVKGKIEFNYHEDFNLPSSYFSGSEGRVAISLIMTDCDLDDLSNLFPSASFRMVQMLEYTKNKDGIKLSHYKRK